MRAFWNVPSSPCYIKKIPFVTALITATEAPQEAWAVLVAMQRWCRMQSMGLDQGTQSLKSECEGE
jgi:hypothetical protein